MLLQNLDSDGDTENRINLGNANGSLSDTNLNIENHKALSFVNSAHISTLTAKVELPRTPQQAQKSITLMHERRQIKTKISSINNAESASRLHKKPNTSYSYDENGNRQSYEVVVDNNATPQSLSEFNFEGSRLISYSYSSLDNSGNTSLQLSESYTYDNEGRRRSYKKDVDGDGNYDTYAQYKYDPQGNRILSAEDLNGDGKADKIWRRQFNKKTLQDPWDQIFSQL